MPNESECKCPNLLLIQSKINRACSFNSLAQCKTIESECNVPFELFNNWLEDAKSNKKIRVPNAACLATCSE